MSAVSGCAAGLELAVKQETGGWAPHPCCSGASLLRQLQPSSSLLLAAPSSHSCQPTASCPTTHLAHAQARSRSMGARACTTRPRCPLSARQRWRRRWRRTPLPTWGRVSAVVWAWAGEALLLACCGGGAAVVPQAGCSAVALRLCESPIHINSRLPCSDHHFIAAE